MFTIDIERLVPKFIIEDKNGYALAKAFQAGLQMLNDIIEDGIKCIYDVDTMPEWRLDELAWEYNIVFDYTADAEVKREWIRNAEQLAASYGTKHGVELFMEARFQKAQVIEWPDYSGSPGDPYHFSINLAGQYTEENDAWAKLVLKKLKNVRSVLDDVNFNAGESDAELWALAGVACYTLSAKSVTQ